MADRRRIELARHAQLRRRHYAGGGASTVLNVKRAGNKKGKKKNGYEAKIAFGVNA